MKRFSFLITYTIAFFAALLILQGVKKDSPIETGEKGVSIEVSKNQIASGKELRVTVVNNLEKEITLEDQCPSPYFEVLKWNNEGEGSYQTVDSSELTGNCEDPANITLKPGQKSSLSLMNYSYSLFKDPGRYKLKLNLGENSYSSGEFSIVEPGFLTKAWRALIFVPILNFLVGLIIFIPGHPLWLAIVLITVLIRTLLLAPSLKAMKSQRKMQELQPKLDALKEKYKDDQAKLAQETMLFWQKNKVNPFSSCLPILIQFPILIALFYVIRAGLSPDKSILLYDFLPDFSLSEINPNFLGFNLLHRDIIVFPIVIGLLQFLQMQLMTWKSKDAKKPDMPSEIESANKMMKYFMPAMIAIFTAQLPSAVGLYWGAGTIYGIVQQLVVNKGGSSQDKADSEGEEIKIRILKKD